MDSFTVINKDKGLFSSDSGLYKLYWNRMLGPQVKKITTFGILFLILDDKNGSFDELVHIKKHRFSFGMKKKGASSSLYKISYEGEVSLFREDTGRIDNYAKMDVGPFEEYLSIQYSDNTFAILSGFEPESKGIREVGGLVEVSRGRVGTISGVRLFGIGKVAVIGRTGVILIFEIVEGKKLRPLVEKRCQLEHDEEVDVFDIFQTGEILSVITKKKTVNQASRLLVHMLNFEDGSDKFLSFDFREQPQKYLKVKQFSGFFSVSCNFIFEGSPVIIGFQEAQGGKTFNIFVCKVEPQKITEISYCEDFLDSKFLLAVVDQENVFVIDALMNLATIKLKRK